MPIEITINGTYALIVAAAYFIAFTWCLCPDVYDIEEGK